MSRAFSSKMSKTPGLDPVPSPGFYSLQMFSFFSAPRIGSLSALLQLLYFVFVILSIVAYGKAKEAERKGVIKSLLTEVAPTELLI